MKICFLQHGDYELAYSQLKSGGDETYRDQRHTVSFVESLADGHDVTVVALCGRLHDTQLSPRLRSLGIGEHAGWLGSTLVSLLVELAPDLFVCRTLSRSALRWAARQGVPTLPIFPAVLEPPRGIKGRLRNWRLRRALTSCRAPCIANHSLNASRSLVDNLGLAPASIVPWELSRVRAQAPKDAPQKAEFVLLYAGALIEQKGVGDLIRAVQLLRARGVEVVARFAGWGESGPWEQLVDELGVRRYVEMLGVVGAAEVQALMRKADAIVVGSHRGYSEGIPNTVFEGLASRSPLVASDHPSYAPRLRHEHDAMIFRAGDAEDLASVVERLVAAPELYRRLSANAVDALDSLYVGREWSELVAQFIEDPENSSGWANEGTLTHVLAGLRG